MNELKVVLRSLSFGINCVAEPVIGDGLMYIFEVSIVAYGLGEEEVAGEADGFGLTEGDGITTGLGLGEKFGTVFPELGSPILVAFPHIKLLPDLMHVNLYPATIAVAPTALQREPVFTAAFAVFDIPEIATVVAITTANQVRFISLDYGINYFSNRARVPLRP